MGIAINSIAFILFVSLGLLFSLHDASKGKLLLDYKKINLTLIAFFLLIILRESLIDIGNLSEVGVSYLAFLLVPMVVALQAERLKESIPLILKWFLIGCLINAAVNLGYAIYRGVLIRDEGVNIWYFTYQFLSEPFGVQPIYLGFFYVFALLILIRYNFFSNPKIWYYLAFGLLALSTILLAARNAILCMIILVPVFFLIYEKGAIKKLLIAGGIIAVCFVVALQNPIIKNRVLKFNKKGNFFSGTSLRYNIWESAYTVSKENFALGSGEKQAANLLLHEFETRELDVPLRHKYHAHSQYLQSLMYYGVIGFLLLLAVFLWPLIRAAIFKNYLAVFWLLLVILTAITESIFTRQWAIFSFAFFSCLFWIDGVKVDENKDETGEI